MLNTPSLVWVKSCADLPWLPLPCPARSKHPHPCWRQQIIKARRRLQRQRPRKQRQQPPRNTADGGHGGPNLCCPSRVHHGCRLPRFSSFHVAGGGCACVSRWSMPAPTNNEAGYRLATTRLPPGYHWLQEHAPVGVGVCGHHGAMATSTIDVVGCTSSIVVVSSDHGDVCGLPFMCVARSCSHGHVWPLFFHCDCWSPVFPLRPPGTQSCVDLLIGASWCFRSGGNPDVGSEIQLGR